MMKLAREQVRDEHWLAPPARSHPVHAIHEDLDSVGGP
jgi:hypothetical protein